MDEEALPARPKIDAGDVGGVGQLKLKLPMTNVVGIFRLNLFEIKPEISR